jgi:hypothetical protein
MGMSQNCSFFQFHSMFYSFVVMGMSQNCSFFIQCLLSLV